MAKRKQYVYVVNATKQVCGNLQSAIEVAMADMYKAEQKCVGWAQLSAQLSAPIVTKNVGRLSGGSSRTSWNYPQTSH